MEVKRVMIGVAVCGLLLISILSPIGNGFSNIYEQNDKEINSQSSSSPEQDIDEGLTSVSSDAIEIQDRIKMKPTVTKIVFTNEPTSLKSFLGEYYEGPLGNWGSNNGIAAPVIEIPASLLEDLYEVEGVLGVYDVPKATPANMPSFDKLGNLDYSIDSNPNPSPSVYNASQNHKAPDAWEMGYEGQGVNVGILDTGIDFAHPELQGTQARYQENFTIKKELVVDSSKDDQEYADLAYGDVMDGSYTLYNNGTEISSSDYSLSLQDGNITFSPKLKKNMKITADYECSPYYGWPMAFDPPSMAGYFSSEGDAESAPWYVNSTKTDLNIWHTIDVDGDKSDYWQDGTEKVAEAGKIHVMYGDLQLDGLYATQDNDNWYYGFDAFCDEMNMSFGFYIDVNNQTGEGADHDPHGKLVKAKDQHLPEYAVYFDHIYDRWGYDKNGEIWTENDTISHAWFYKWTGSEWEKRLLDDSGLYEKETFTAEENQEYMKLQEKNISQDTLYVQVNNFILEKGTDFSVDTINGNISFEDPLEEGDEILVEYTHSLLVDKDEAGEFHYDNESNFIEFKVPKKLVDEKSNVWAELFTTGANESHAQDSVPLDLDDTLKISSPDWSNNVTTLTNFIELDHGKFMIDYYYDNTGIDYSTFSGGYFLDQYNTWRSELIVPNSESGEYHIGIHPDNKLPGAPGYKTPIHVLAVDENEAGVYDTVYVDLDNDRDFTDEKPLTKGDEISYFDFHDSASGISNIDWSPEGGFLASAGRDHLLNVYNTSNSSSLPNSPLFTTQPKISRLTSIKFSPSGNYLALGSTYNTILIYDTNNWQIVHRLVEPALPDRTRINSLDWSLGGNEIASVYEDGKIRIWDVSTESIDRTINVYSGFVNSIDWSPDGSMIAASWDKNATIYDASNGNIVSSCENGHTQKVTDVEFNTNSSYLATSSLDTNVVLWNSSNGNSITTLAAGFSRPLISISWSPDGMYIATGSKTQNGLAYSRIFNITNGNTLPSGQFTYTVDIKDVSFNPNSTWLDPSGKNFGLSAGSTHKKPGTNQTGKLTIRNATSGDAHMTYYNHTTSCKDYSAYNIGDGIADISGGMIYFVSNGHTPLPYSRTYAERYGYLKVNNTESEEEFREKFIPGNGDLIAFTGDFNGDPNTIAPTSHGTMIAHSIAAQGRTTYTVKSSQSTRYKGWEMDLLKGISPKAKLVPIADIYSSNFVDAWYFAVEGYDGKPGTGDECNIASNSFGFSSSYNDGLDHFSRMADYITHEHGEGNTLFTVSASNDGWGYGTVTSPASGPAVLSVGASTDFSDRRYTTTYEDGIHPVWGQIASFSARGPSTLGKPEPDLLANGRQSISGAALNEWSVDGMNGINAWSIFQGTSLASPNAAAISALIYNAYFEENGAYPDTETAINIIKSSAMDINHDVFHQGSGIAMADTAVKLASNQEGLLINKTDWNPGDYRGQRYEAFPNIINEDTKESHLSQKFNLKNDGNQTIQADVKAETYQKIGEYEYNFTTRSNESDHWFMLLSEDTHLTNIHPDYQHGLYDMYKFAANPSDPSYSKVASNLTLWENASLMKITLNVPFEEFDTNDNDKIDAEDPYYVLDSYRWNETDPFDVNKMGPDVDKYSDLNRINIDGRAATVYETRVHDPASMADTGILFNLGGFQLYGAAMEGATGLNFNISVEFYNRTETPLINIDNNNLNIGAGIDEEFTATVNLPSDIKMGTYEVGLYVYYENETIVVPTCFHVAGKGADISFGNNTKYHDALFRGDEIMGGYGSPGQSGDWRFYYTDFPDTLEVGENRILYFDMKWDGNYTDMNLKSFSQAPQYSKLSEERYGPYALDFKDGSDETPIGYTTTGGPREITTAPISPGLNIIGIRNVQLDGTKYYDTVREVKVGSITTNPSEINVKTDSLYGKKEYKVMSTIPWDVGSDNKGIGALAAGPSAPESYKDLEIPQDDISGTDFIKMLAKGSYTKVVKVQKSCLIFDVHIWGHSDAPDLDLGIFLDGKGDGNIPDGIAQKDEFIAYGADADADEHVKLIQPDVMDDPDTPDVNELEEGAPYIIKVLGFTTTTGLGHFDMDVTIVQGEGFSVVDRKDGVMNTFEMNSFNLTWNFSSETKDGTFLGALFIGPGIAPLTKLVPISINLDLHEPTIESVMPERGRYISDDTPVISAGFTDDWIEIELEKKHNVSKHIGGYNQDHWIYEEEEITHEGTGIDTSSAKIYVDGVRKVTSVRVTEKSINFEPTSPLSEGMHSVEVEVNDLAGNKMRHEWNFYIDKTPLNIELSNLYDGYCTQESNISFAGTSEFDTESITTSFTYVDDDEVLINEQEMDISSSHEFDGTLSMEEEGQYLLEITGEDWSGNSVHHEYNIYRDLSAPSINIPPTNIPEFTRDEIVYISGDVDRGAEPADVKLKVNENEVDVYSDGSFEVPLQLDEGGNSFDFEVIDSAGHITTEEISIVKDTIISEFRLNEVENVDKDTILISGTAEEDSSVTINGRPVLMDGNSFEKEMDIVPGRTNEIIVHVEDRAGNTEQIVKNVDMSEEAEKGLSDYIGWIAGIAVIALILGLLIGFIVLPKFFGAEEEPVEKAIIEEEPEEELGEEVGEMEEEEEISDEDIFEEEPEQEISDEDIFEEEPEQDIPEEPGEEEIPEKIEEREAPGDEPEIGKTEEEIPEEEQGEDISEDIMEDIDEEK